MASGAHLRISYFVASEHHDRAVRNIRPGGAGERPGEHGCAFLVVYAKRVEASVV